MGRSAGSGYVPVSPETAFAIWADFKKFPKFMPGCVQVVLAGTVASVTLEHNGTKEDSQIAWSVIEKPRRLVWRSRGGAKWNWEVTFRPDGDGTMITINVDFEPASIREKPAEKRIVTPTWPVAETILSFKRYVE